jgi:hypothetical protein
VSDPDHIAEAAELFRILVHGRVVDKTAAQERIVDRDPRLDRSHLRRLLLAALEEAYPPGERSRVGVRCWLLSALGRVADDDARCREYVVRHVHAENEPSFWARYWALESLAVGSHSDLPKLAREVVEKDEQPLVAMLARAILAAQGDSAAEDGLLDGLDVEELSWAVLRALRVVPLDSAVDRLCALVASPTGSDQTYDAIVALGALSPGSDRAEQAVGALMDCVKKSRRHPWFDGMRIKALGALRNLAPKDAAPLFVDELSDSNPAIVYEAARALEGTLGVPVATARVIEAASQAGEQAFQQYANALRWMDREEVAEELESVMQSGTGQEADTARSLLAEIGGSAAFQKLRARTDAMKQHLEWMEATESNIRGLFDASLLDARTGYRLAIGMDVVIFLLGVGAMVFSAWLVVTGREALAGLTAVGGTLGILYNLFIANPRKQVEQSVRHLMTLKVVFLGYLRQLHQNDQAFARRFLDNRALEAADVAAFSKLVDETIHRAVGEIRGPEPKTKAVERAARSIGAVQADPAPARPPAAPLVEQPGT